MQRLHRSLNRRIKKIDANRVANLADDYIDGYRLYRRDLEGVKGLVNIDRVKKLVKEIDTFQKETERLERKLEKLRVRRAEKAVRLEDVLQANLEVVNDYLSPEQYRDFLDI